MNSPDSVVTINALTNQVIAQILPEKAALLVLDSPLPRPHKADLVSVILSMPDKPFSIKNSHNPDQREQLEVERREILTIQSLLALSAVNMFAGKSVTSKQELAYALSATAWSALKEAAPTKIDAAKKVYTYADQQQRGRDVTPRLTDLLLSQLGQETDKIKHHTRQSAFAIATFSLLVAYPKLLQAFTELKPSPVSDFLPFFFLATFIGPQISKDLQHVNTSTHKIKSIKMLSKIPEIMPSQAIKATARLMKSS